MHGTLLNCDEACRFIDEIQDPVTRNLMNLAFVHLVKHVQVERRTLPMADVDMLILVNALTEFFGEP